MRARLEAKFTAGGIDPSRLDLLGHTKTQYEHFDLYNQIDLALDTFPYNGGTTTCEALHMGVPVVTYAEPGRPFRMGAGLLGGRRDDRGVSESLNDQISLAAAVAKDTRPSLNQSKPGQNQAIESALLNL